MEIEKIYAELRSDLTIDSDVEEILMGINTEWENYYSLDDVIEDFLTEGYITQDDIENDLTFSEDIMIRKMALIFKFAIEHREEYDSYINKLREEYKEYLSEV